MIVGLIIGTALNWEYAHKVGAFDTLVRQGVVVFDASHGSLDNRVIVSSGKCIFTVGQEYAWVEVGVPYLVNWRLDPATPNYMCRLISIAPIG